MDEGEEVRPPVFKGEGEKKSIDPNGRAKEKRGKAPRVGAETRNNACGKGRGKRQFFFRGMPI